MRRILVLSTVLAYGCQDTGITVYDEPPSITIVQPTSGSTFYENQQILLEALVEMNDDTDISTITTRWTAGNEQLCNDVAVAADGVSQCEAAFTEAGDYSLQATAVTADGDGATATTDVVVLVNTPPTISLTEPVDGDVFSSVDQVVMKAVVYDVEDDLSDLRVTVTSNVDGSLSVDDVPSSSGDWSGATLLTSGSHLLKVTVADTLGQTGQASATIQVNDPPSTPVVTINPGDPVSYDKLNAVISEEAVDPEGDPIDYVYQWYVDGKPYSGNVPSVPENVTLRGEFWEVEVYATDSYGDGNPTTDGVTIGNSPPSIESVSIDPSEPDTSDTPTCVVQNWDDPEGDDEKSRYAWYLNGSLDASETTSTYPPSKTERYDQLRCTVTPYDAYVDGESVSSPTVEVVNALPSTPTVSISPSAPEPEDDLTCTATGSTDADGDVVSYQYAWSVGGVATAYATAVLDESATSHSDTWTCTVTPTDGIDSGTAASATVTISDTTAPDAPSLDSLDAYSNDEDQTVTGTCEASCDLTFYFTDDGGSWTETDTCSSSGTLSHSAALTRGYETEVYADCEDAAGNVSGVSNTVSTEVCDPEDTYENDDGYGDSVTDAIDEWSSLTDDGLTTITITGNALSTSDTDWYVISTSDDGANETSNSWEDYNFEATFTQGESTYEMSIYDASVSTSTPLCSGVTEFDYFSQDVGDGSHSIPSDTTSCVVGGSVSANTCEDWSRDWYIEVTRLESAASSCQYYEIEITNGVW